MTHYFANKTLASGISIAVLFIAMFLFVHKTHAASCGTAHRKVFSSQPTSNLCSSGTASLVSYSQLCTSSGPNGECSHWSWKCGTELCLAWDASDSTNNTGSETTPTTSSTSGVCGLANGRDFTSQPTTGLCTSGTLSTISYSPTCVSPGGPDGRCEHWYWKCGTTNCSAWDISNTNGSSDGGTSNSCGSANGKDFTSQPTTNLCSSGSPTSGPTYSPTCVSPGGPGGRCANWRWTCGTASCSAWDISNTNTGEGSGSASTIKISGYCGNAAKNYSNTETQFSGSFCYTGIQEPVNPSFPPQNGSSQWVCKGLTGGTDSNTCVATRNNTLPQSCSLYTSSTTIPSGYGSPFNQLSSAKESTLGITCSDTGAIVTAGSVESNTYVYKTGFVSENGTWSKIDFSGNPDPANVGWFKGTATTNLIASSSQNFTLAFVCQYSGGTWKCGCRDSACTQNYWTIQSYKK